MKATKNTGQSSMQNAPAKQGKVNNQGKRKKNRNRVNASKMQQPPDKAALYALTRKWGCKESGALAAMAMFDPFLFRLKGVNVGLPDTISTPSEKVILFQRGTGFIGTLGIGYIAINPQVTVNGTVGVVTGQLFNQNIISTNQGDPGVSPVPGMGSPYAVGSGAKSRVVAFGVRVRFIGQTLQTQGLVLPITNSECVADSTIRAQTFDNLARGSDVSTFNFDKRWQGTVLKPMIYNGGDYAASQVVNSNSEVYSGCIISSSPGFPFEYEIVQLLESISSTARAVLNTSESPCDLDALQNLSSAFGCLSRSTYGLQYLHC